MAVLLVLATIAAYWPALHNGFIWDDDVFLVTNRLIRAGDGLYRFWFTTEAPDYFPMTSTTLWLEWRLWGDAPVGYHLVNVLLHAASSVLLWRVLARLKIPGAWFGAALFALHPVSVESVAWITERKNTLAMFFYAGALLSYLCFEDTGQRRWYALGLAAFALGLFSKSAIAPLPVVLLGVAAWRRGRLEWRDMWRAVPFFALAALLGLITVWFQFHRAMGGQMVRPDGFWTRLAGAGWSIWFYLYKALWPVNLIFVYPRWSVDGSKVLAYVPGLLVLAAGCVCWQHRRGWGRPVLFALGYFVVMLLPVLGFLDIYFMRFSLVADHWQYFSILGPVTLVGGVLAGAGPGCGIAGPRWRIAVGCGLLCGLGVLTWQQSKMYHDMETLWRTTIARNPHCWLAQNMLGVYLAQEGRIDEAISQYRAGLRVRPNDAGVYDHLGTELVKKGQLDEAIHCYQEAIRLKPDFVDAHNDLGYALALAGRNEEAIPNFQECLRLKPNSFMPHLALARTLPRLGGFQEAASHMDEFLRTCPPAALEAPNSAVRGLALGALNDLAWYLATNPREEDRDGVRAVRFAELACQLTQYRLAIMVGTLGGAYAEAGRFSEAVTTAEMASTLASQAGDQALLAKNHQLLELYRAGRPYHEAPTPAQSQPASSKP